MNLYLRLFLVLINSIFSKKIGLFENSICKFRVLPNDADINLHLNNGRYFSIMDLGRVDLAVRCGLFVVCIKHKWLPVIGSEMIRFIGELKMLTTYEIRTNFIGCDQKWFYIRQDFYQKEKRMARAYVRGAFLDGKRKGLPEEILKALGLPLDDREKHSVAEEIKEYWNSVESKLLGDFSK